ncbi:MAG: hypothetical protein ACREKL_14810 [Chthoniobacterales bacterium]
MTPSVPRRRRTWLVVGIAIVVWFVLAEIACQAWYYAHESKLKINPIPATGQEVIDKLKNFAMQRDAYSIHEEDVGETPREILNCSYAKTLSWVVAGRISAVTVIRWDDRSSAGGVESSHNPGNCLQSAGWTIGTRTNLGFDDYCGVTAEVTEWEVQRPGIQMTAYSAVFRRFAGAPTIVRKTSRADLRWGAVWSGRRDAPMLVVLVYLVGDPSDQARVREQFKTIMRTAFCSDGNS